LSSIRKFVTANRHFWARGSWWRQVLQQVAKGMPWTAITAEWRGSVTKDAIAEAVQLAQRTFDDHALQFFPN
jgi:hypothetical protein